jgi:hypothetical protein
VREIVERLFLGQQNWRTADLLREAYHYHIENDGLEIQNSEHTLRRVLGDLRDEQRIISTGHGYWALNDAHEQQSALTEEHEPQLNEPLSEPIMASTSNPEDKAGPSLKPEAELGTGSECVYVYFNENDRRLAELENRQTWECKVGRTADSTVTNRILNQGISTALSRTPTVGLVIHTDDSSLLERALHCSLRMAEADYDEAVGSEWFMTSPAIIQKWYELFCQSVQALKIKKSEQLLAGDG